MEKAIFINDVTDSSNVQLILSKDYERLYYGNEFCGRDIPDEQNLLEVMNFCLKNKLKFTFLTPFVTEFEFEKLANIFEFIDHEYNNLNSLDLEVSINDFGLFEYIKQHNYKFKINMGRLLTHQKKDPDFFTFCDTNNRDNKIDNTILSHIKGSNVDSNDEINNFIQENFNAIELENTFQGFHLNSGIKINLYYPMISVATTRYCIFASKEITSINATQYINCHKSCKEGYMINRLPHLTMYLRGNTQFYFNDKLPDNLERVSRLIYYNFLLS